MTKNDDFKTLDRPTSLANLAYIRDGKITHVGAEVIYLACVVACSSASRTESNEREISRMFGDINLE